MADTNSLATRQKTVAFAFDIDGVLVNGKVPIPGARETLIKLQENNIPFMFLTNSGGVTEKENLEKLASRLGGIEFDERQIVQSHTPFRALVDEYRDKKILVLGGHGDSIRRLANTYGFNDVVTSSDLMAHNEHVHPFPEMTRDHHAQHGRGVSDDKPLQIAAIFIWSSPRDWCLDLQLTLDLLLSSKGILGTRSGLNGQETMFDHGYMWDGQPKLFMCNPDFEWSTKHEQPRLAQGGFREALRGLWNYATKGAVELEYTLCGKPTETTYKFGEQVLHDFVAANANLQDKDIQKVYMIGDNPESDIAGANAYKSQYNWTWRSVLVETGVYRPGTTPAHIPSHTAKNVQEAVEWALAENGIILE